MLADGLHYIELVFCPMVKMVFVVRRYITARIQTGHSVHIIKQVKGPTIQPVQAARAVLLHFLLHRVHQELRGLIKEIDQYLLHHTVCKKTLTRPGRHSELLRIGP